MVFSRGATSSEYLKRQFLGPFLCLVFQVGVVRTDTLGIPFS